MGKRRQLAAPSIMAAHYSGYAPPHSMPSWGATAKRSLLVGASVLALVAASDVVIPPRPAYAVICANGGACGTPAGIDGGTSTNTACGILANASGTTSNNVANGSNANASGNSASNVATGFNSNASGNNSQHFAGADGANASGTYCR